MQSFSDKKTCVDIVDVSVTLFANNDPNADSSQNTRRDGCRADNEPVYGPLNSLIGLPVEMAIVLTTTMLPTLCRTDCVSNLPVGDEFTVAQATILAVCC